MAEGAPRDPFRDHRVAMTGTRRHETSPAVCDGNRLSGPAPLATHPVGAGHIDEAEDRQAEPIGMVTSSAMLCDSRRLEANCEITGPFHP